jgi:hypothetical protein
MAIVGALVKDTATQRIPVERAQSGLSNEIKISSVGFLLDAFSLLCNFRS